MDLQEARQHIDEIDKELIALYEKRLQVVLEVAKYKEKHNMKIFDAEREKQVIAKNLARVEDAGLHEYVEEFLHAMMDISKKYQKHHIQQHIFLVGMPGAGKTTVGRALAQSQGMDFYDLDAMVQKKADKSIQNIIIHDGEPRFRQYEQEVIRELLGQKPSVIATGGGTVLSEETVKLMRESGFIVFIHRDVTQILEDMDLEIRPLLKESIEYIFRLYEERCPLYEKVCNVKILNISNISDAVEAIEAALPLGAK